MNGNAWDLVEDKPVHDKRVSSTISTRSRFGSEVRIILNNFFNTAF